MLALPLIFQRLRELGRAPEAAADELLETVKIYNTVPPGEEEDYRAAITSEYAAFCQEVRAMSRTAMYHTDVKWTGEHWLCRPGQWP